MRTIGWEYTRASRWFFWIEHAGGANGFGDEGDSATFRSYFYPPHVDRAPTAARYWQILARRSRLHQHMIFLLCLGGKGLLLRANENHMRSFSLRKRIAAPVFCLLLLPGTAIAQANESDEFRESLSQSIQKSRTSGHLPEAEKLLVQAISLDENADGPSSRRVAEDLDMLSDVLSEDEKYAEAETTLKAAMAIEVIDGPQVASNYYLGKLASLAGRQQRFAEAERIYKELLAIQSREQGFEDPAALRDLAELYHLAKDYPDSEAIYKKVIESKSLEPGSGVVLGSIEALCTVYEDEGKFEEVEALYRKSIHTNQTILPRGHLVTIAELNDLGLFYERRERLQEAEESYKRALAQFDGLASGCSLMDSDLAIVIGNYTRLLRTEGRLNESEQFESRAKAIRDKLSGNCSKQ
jgi:tetratricopeptide (TPR) repeat protein